MRFSPIDVTSVAVSWKCVSVELIRKVTFFMNLCVRIAVIMTYRSRYSVAARQVAVSASVSILY